MRGGRINFWVNEQHLKSPEGPDSSSTSDGAVVPLIFLKKLFCNFYFKQRKTGGCHERLVLLRVSSLLPAGSLDLWVSLLVPSRSFCWALYYALPDRHPWVQVVLGTRWIPGSTGDHCRKGQMRPVVHKFTLVLCCYPSALLKWDFWCFYVIFLCCMMKMDGFDLCSI